MTYVRIYVHTSYIYIRTCIYVYISERTYTLRTYVVLDVYVLYVVDSYSTACVWAWTHTAWQTDERVMGSLKV